MAVLAELMLQAVMQLPAQQVCRQEQLMPEA